MDNARSSHRHDSAVSRRDFLAGSAAISVALTLSACLRSAKPRDSTLIVGGGLAGLRTLDLLRRRGWDAHLLEGAPILGGRMRTRRHGLPPGLTVELGAERVTEDSKRLNELIRELGLETVEYPQPPGAFVLRLDGEFHRFSRTSDLPDSILSKLNDRERGAWPFFVHRLYCDESHQVAQDDPRTGLEWLKAQGLSAMGERLVRAFCPVPVARMSAWDFWLSTLRDKNAGATRTVAGGVDLIVRRLADRHPGHITNGVDIVSVDRMRGGVEIRDTTGRSWRGSRVVLALPLIPLTRLRFEPERPELVKAWTAGRELAQEIRVHIDYDEAEVARQGLSPYFMGLDFPRMTWPRPESTPDGRRILSTVAFREDIETVRNLRAAGDSGLRDLIRSRIPQIKSFGPKVFSHDFNVDPRIGGTYPYQLPGAPAAPRTVRDGPLILAGGDFSSRPGSMEGALESAERAVAEVLDA